MKRSFVPKKAVSQERTLDGRCKMPPQSKPKSELSLLERTILLGAAALGTSMRPFAQAVTLSVALVVVGGLTAQFANAASICKKVTHTKFGETRARFGPTLGSVRKDGSTHAVIYHLDRKAPLGWSHSLRIWKDNRKSDWRLQLVAVNPMANANQSFVLQIDREPQLTFAKPHIKSPQSINEYELTSKTGVLGRTIDDLRAGNQLKWQYTSESGSKASIVFSLSGLTAALRWLDCARTPRQSSNLLLISDDRKGTNKCQSDHISCMRRMPTDYQGHPGREANWQTECEVTRTKCLSQSGPTANAHWCNSNNLNLSEKMICKSGGLRRLDAKLREVYTTTTEGIATKGRAHERLPLLKKQQLEWIKERNRCGAKLKCLTRSYEARLVALAGSPSDPAFVGTWGTDLTQCRVPQEQQGSPMVLTKVGYDRHETHCTFKSTKKLGDLWKIAAECSVEGDKLSDAFTLKTAGNILTMTRGKFSAKLKRCE